MQVRGYSPRVVDSEIASALERSGALLVVGAKGSGKTESARQHSRSEVRVDIDPSVAIAMGIDPRRILAGETPRLLDEWQVQPILWDVVRHEVDDRRKMGQFILTGSTAPVEAAMRHSGAGRFSRLKMRTMSFYESGDSSGQGSLGLLGDKSPYLIEGDEVSIEQLAARIARGGWPGYLPLDDEQTHRNLKDYVQTIAELDINTPDGARRDPVRVLRVIQSLARGVGTEMSVAAIAKDADLSRDTTQEYLDSLERIFISEDQLAWSPALRSRTPLRKAPKRHLADPALALAALDKSLGDLVNDLEFLGQVFESQVVHDLRVLTGENVYHARNANGDEVDAVIKVGTNTVLVEIKLGYAAQVVDQAAKSLLKFASLLKDGVELLVVTGGGMAYRRPDGVNVIPLGMLAP